MQKHCTGCVDICTTKEKNETMLLTISTNKEPATDLGYLLHKHPDKLQKVDLSIGCAHIFYPEANKEKTTIALLLEIDPIDMVKKARSLSGKEFALGQYVNDRPYVASSFMSVAISKAFSTAMNGKCQKRPELVSKCFPLEVIISVLPAPKGGELLIRKLFEPLGYELTIERYQRDEVYNEWGESKYYTVTLKNNITIKDLLSHLYVLIPALDNDKHYFVSKEEVNKLLLRGEGWLNNHPEKEQIINRYLINLRGLSRIALNELSEDEEGQAELSEELKVKKETLHQKRLNLALEKLIESKANKVIDLGCGEGKLIRMLLKHKQFERITGVDVSYNELLKAKERLNWDELAPRQKERLDLFQGALTYRDKRFNDFDAAALVEVIEHLDENRLTALERVIFEIAQPKTVVLTTPNGEYNTLFESMEAGTLRHKDHRFEWSREEFKNWVSAVCDNHNYSAEIFPVGEEDINVGAPSQMAVFTLKK